MNTKKAKLLKLGLISLVTASALYSDGHTLESEFLSLLNEASTIATKTKVNIDHQPSTISIINRETLQNSSFRNIHEALSSLPGFEGYITNLGWKELTVRGVYTANAYGFDKIKLLIDGVSVNNTLYGTIYYYLDLPIELVERIEVLRGPGSVLYGSGAFSGVINIITKKETEKNDLIFSSIDSYGFLLGGTKIFRKIDDIDLQIDAYYQKDDKRLDVKQRRNSTGTTLDGKTSEFLRDYSVGLSAQKDTFSVTSRIKKSKSGEYYGSSEFEVGVDKSKGYDNSIFFIESEYKQKLDLGNINYKAGFTNYSLDSLFTDKPKGKVAYDLKKDTRDYLKSQTDESTADYLMTSFNIENFIDENIHTNYLNGYYSKEQKAYTEVSFESQYNNHTINGGIEHSYSKIISNKSVNNNYTEAQMISSLNSLLGGSDASTLDLMHADLQVYDNQFIGEGKKRTVNSIYLQDLIALNDKTDLRIGYRVDDYSDIDEKPDSYSLGLVHRLNEQTNFKISYGYSYRAPSFIELYTQPAADTRAGNSDLKPEGIKTTEASILYKPNTSTRVQTTLFSSVLKDVIDLSIDCDDLSNEEEAYIPCANGGSYWNYDERRIKGLEVEYRQEIDNKNEISVNYTYLDTLAKGWQPFFTVNTQKDVALADISEELANLSYTHFFDKRLFFNTNIQYTGEKIQNSREKRLDESVVVDENINYRLSPKEFFQLSIKNIFNDKKHYPSIWSFHDEGLEREGRHFALKYIMEI